MEMIVMVNLRKATSRNVAERVTYKKAAHIPKVKNLFQNLDFRNEVAPDVYDLENAPDIYDAEDATDAVIDSDRRYPCR